MLIIRKSMLLFIPIFSLFSYLCDPQDDISLQAKLNPKLPGSSIMDTTIVLVNIISELNLSPHTESPYA